MPLDVHRNFVPEEMIRNFPRPNATVFVEILAPTSVRGEHLQPGNEEDGPTIVEVLAEDAGNIVASGRGKIVPKPETTEVAAGEGETTTKKAKKAAKAAKDADKGADGKPE